MVRMFQAMLVCVLVATVAPPFPAVADDVQNCNWPYAEDLLKTQPAAVESACRRLAKKGVAWAQFNLGAIYDQALGVSPDYKEAAKWYKRSADKGYAPAQYNLGRLYANGRGVQTDFVEAYRWFTLAAKVLPPGTDRDRAIRNRDKVAAYMMPQQILEAEALADRFEPND